MAPSALGGVKVLDLSRHLAGPYCAMMLGDLGAESLRLSAPAQATKHVSGNRLLRAASRRITFAVIATRRASRSISNTSEVLKSRGRSPRTATC